MTETKITAVITAAVTAYLAAEQQQRSEVPRVPPLLFISPWAQVGRQRIMGERSAMQRGWLMGKR